MSIKDYNDIIQTIEHLNITTQQTAWNSTSFSNIKKHHILKFITIRDKLKRNLKKQ